MFDMKQGLKVWKLTFEGESVKKVIEYHLEGELFLETIESDPDNTKTFWAVVYTRMTAEAPFIMAALQPTEMELVDTDYQASASDEDDDKWDDEGDEGDPPTETYGSEDDAEEMLMNFREESMQV